MPIDLSKLEKDVRMEHAKTKKLVNAAKSNKIVNILFIHFQ